FDPWFYNTLGVPRAPTTRRPALPTTGTPEVVQLGSRRAEIPSLVFLREDGVVLVGDAAERRGAREPARLAREFKRRLGDPVPVLVGGSPISAHALMARVLEHVHQTVTRSQEGPPARVSVTHPANWGPYKRELLMQAMVLAEVPDVQLRSEPEAAAVQYAAQERVQAGEIIAVYDLGGGTFDAAVLRKTATGFELLGEPAGIEQLGGVDFDEAVLAHVLDMLGPRAQQLDPSDPSVVEALSQLRRDCVIAKEDLSADTEVLIPVALPSMHTRVRLNRSEFEAMISPALSETVAAMRRALRSAGIAPTDLRSILLAGGSSRIPLVSELLSTEFGRPLVLDANPEHSIALGAAMAARDGGGMQSPSRPFPAPPVEPAPPVQPGKPYPTSPYPTEQISPAPDGPPAYTPGQPAPVAQPQPQPGVYRTGAAPIVQPQPPVGPPPAGKPSPTPPFEPAPSRSRRGPIIAVAAAAVAVLLIGSGVAWAMLRGDGDRGETPAGGGPTSAGPAAPQVIGSWKQLANLPVQLEGAAVAAYKDKIWVAGGLSNDEARTKLTSVYLYDPKTDKWAKGPTLPQRISHGSLVATPWSLYFLAGWVQDGGSKQVLKLNPTGTAWIPDVPLPEPRVAGAAAYDGSHVIFAGGTRKGGAPTDTVWSLTDGKWKSIGKLGEPRQKLTAVSNNVDTVWVLGGRDAQKDTKSAQIDRIAQGKVAEPPTVRIDPPIDSSAAVRLDGIGMCLVGGEMPGKRYNDWWCDQTGVAATLPKLDPPRAGLGVARLGRTIYVVGGYGANFQGLDRVESFTVPG
ncbi:Hsp70 family protein, partial [Actinoplanes sp. NPDC051633]|uniref:Hsp70 family protein n=1 Tax=Actinoplanes sp. NPDC051633 TaxID=3155670 RepID=UPI0034145C6A